LKIPPVIIENYEVIFISFQDKAKQKIQDLEERLERVEDRQDQQLKIKKVDTENGPRVILEHTVQRWLSPKYIDKVMEDDQEKSEKQKNVEGNDARDW